MKTRALCVWFCVFLKKKNCEWIHKIIDENCGKKDCWMQMAVFFI